MVELILGLHERAILSHLQKPVGRVISNPVSESVMRLQTTRSTNRDSVAQIPPHSQPLARYEESGLWNPNGHKITAEVATNMGLRQVFVSHQKPANVARLQTQEPGRTLLYTLHPPPYKKPLENIALQTGPWINKLLAFLLTQTS